MTEPTYTITGLQSELKKAEQRGIDLERERIIKLLEENAHTEQHYSVGFYESDPLIYLDEAIALIKGENK